MSIFFVSDTHFGHSRVIEYSKRPFRDVSEMDEALITNWNMTVGKRDDVYHLGDFSFHTPLVSASIIKRLNGKKFLIKGNHDKKHFLKECSGLFEWVKDYNELKFDGQRIVLSHFPFMTWNASHYGSWHLHGHCHGSLPDDNSVLRIDVGVDCHSYTPVSMFNVFELMKKKMFTRQTEAVDK